MSVNLRTLLAEIEADFPNYSAANLIDEQDVIKWARTALKKFGQSICTLQDGIVLIKDGKGILPENFHSLNYAVKCSPCGINYKEEDVPVLQNTLIWNERIERSSQYSSCEPCVINESEKIITENIYLNDKVISFYYDSPIPLKLTKGIKKDFCASKCRNMYISDSPYEINIVNQRMLNTNFGEGIVYVQYYGLDLDEEGEIVIPETPRGELYTYVEYFVKKKLFEKLLSNGDDTNVVTLFQYYVGEEKRQFVLASSDAKFMTLTPSSYVKLKKMNRLQMLKYEMLLPSNF